MNKNGMLRGCVLGVLKVTKALYSIGILSIYLLLIGRLRLSDNATLFLIRFACEVVRIVLSVATFFLVYSKLNKEINSTLEEGYYLATMPLAFGIVLLIGVKIYILNPHGIDQVGFDLYKQALEWLQIGMLIILMKWYRGEKKIQNSVFVVLGAMGIVILLSIEHTPVLDDFFAIPMCRCASRMLTIVMLVVVVFCHKKYLSNLFLQRMFMYSLCIKAAISGIGIIRIITDNLIFAILQGILQIVYMMWTIACINEYNYKTSWAKMEFEIEDKQREGRKELYNQELLGASVNTIKKTINGMVIRLEELESYLDQNKEENKLRYIGKMRDNCGKLYDLSQQIINPDCLCRENTTFSFVYINICDQIQELIEAMEPYIREKGIAMEYCVAEHNIKAQINPEALERILFNLISNAVKYNKKEGTIRVILSQRQEWVYLCVQDSGIGIPGSHIPTIFDKYERVESQLTRKQEGSGVGLNNVKELVEKHHGEIKIVSQEGKGTLVCVKMPVSQEEKENHGLVNKAFVI